MTDKPMPLLIGTTAAVIILVGLAVLVVGSVLFVVKAILCH